MNGKSHGDQPKNDIDLDELLDLDSMDYLSSSVHDDDSLIDSIARMEKALAKLLEAQAEVLKEQSPHWTDKQIAHFTKMMEKSLKKIILKEIVLLLILEEDHEPKKKKHKKHKSDDKLHKDDCDCHDDHKKHKCCCTCHKCHCEYERLPHNKCCSCKRW